MEYDEREMELHATDNYTSGVLDGLMSVEIILLRSRARGHDQVSLEDLLSDIQCIEQQFKTLRLEEYISMRTEALMAIEPKEEPPKVVQGK